MSHSNVRACFRACAEENRAALVAYLTHGDGGIEASIDLAEAVLKAGADVLELGVPFSDPAADGPVIQAGMHRALEQGACLSTALEAVQELRRRGVKAPVVLFGYYNPFLCRGLDVFAKDAASAGVDAVLTVDLPIDELGELAHPLKAQGVGVVPLVAPTSTQERIARTKAFEPSFTYYVAKLGITGSGFAGTAGGRERVAMIGEQTGAPVAVGFGIRSPSDAASVAALADGVIVGSAIVRCANESEDPIAATTDLVRSLAAAMMR